VHGHQDVQRVVALYIKRRFNRSGISEGDEKELQKRWLRLRSLIWREILTRRRRQRRPHTPSWVPASSLRPPTSLE